MLACRAKRTDNRAIPASADRARVRETRPRESETCARGGVTPNTAASASCVERKSDESQEIPEFAFPVAPPPTFLVANFGPCRLCVPKAHSRTPEIAAAHSGR